MTSESRLPSDRALEVATRAGDDAAWAELTARHREAVRRFARGAGIDDRQVDVAFSGVRSRLAITTGGEPALPGLRAVRPQLLQATAGVAAGPAASGDPTLTTIAVAFGELPEDWQAVLWHRCVDRAPAVEATVVLGRSTAEVLALEQTATRGLFEQAMLVELRTDASLPPLCRPVVAALGAYRRGSLPWFEERAIEEHLHGGTGVVGCSACRERLEVAARIPELVAPAVTAWVVGRTPDDYRAAAGIAIAVGAAALADRRTVANRRRARVLATAAVLLALLAASVLIRSPFRSLEPGLADLLDRTSTTIPDVITPRSTIPPGPVDGDPNRVELVFPEAPRGIVYVPGGRPLNLSAAVSSPAPVFAGGTGTVDVRLTNNDTVAVDVTFYVRTSDGVSFDEQTEGEGTCRAEDDDGATCSVSIGAGATALKSLRFTVDRRVPDRFVIDPGLGGTVLDMPVVFLADLALGTVERGHLKMFTGVLAECVAPECIGPAEWTDAADAAGATSAYLVWHGAPGAAAPPRVELVVGDDVTSVRPMWWTAVGGATYRVADVTGPLADAAPEAGRLAVTSGAGGGTWTLIVVTPDPGAPRRLLVVTVPDATVDATSPFATSIPVAGSEPPLTPRRLGTLDTVAVAVEPGTSTLSVDDVAIGGLDPFGLAASGSSPSVRSYDLDIDSSSAAVQIAASTTTAELRLMGLALVLDIVP